MADTLNIALKPFERAYVFLKKSTLKTKETFPAFYRYFEALVKQHITTPSKGFFKSSRIDNVSSFITANVVKRLPHVDESQVEEILHNPSNKSFLEILTKGFGINREKERTYTVLGNGSFKKILIANRGEIALRIIRACRELGIESTVIYSDEEKDSLAVKFADKSYNIGKSKNYLNIKKMVNIAKQTGCDAVHPGYGFLSENPRFAKLCERKGIKFIGPSSKMIKQLGDKVEAKNAMTKAGIPVLEGIKESLRSSKHALLVARRIGLPVILKASAGGGGKGMRIVHKEEEIFEAYESAKKEALNAFGDESLYIEKYLEEPRHIEFQILVDKYGNVIHLGERDCSIQRRHQKLIEESPSPALSNELRQTMGNAAVNAVRAIGYEGAGTIEFLLDKSKNFYFIEMNTRIQVEHGVTEVVTNVDLVKEQIKLASGAKLAYNQENIKIEGHAIECRINAEDPSKDFSPSPGTIVSYLPPGGPGIRISSSCHSGCKILPQFDSLIALLICHGSTRQEAIARMKRALQEFIIEGVKTTIPFHQSVLSKRQFLRGNVTTSFIENNKIMEELKGMKPKKETLPKDKRVLIITTAVSQYLAKKQQINSKSKVNPWVMAARQEAMNEGSLEE
ncbi:acetyl-CoA carboxylase biotin carboxylase subunit [Candidatus Woesearchaeota archaeon]|nr:acetyl-CoA carboxylase biotin carboxylase subunit [Candidatus Woesearchaeota archaeon]